MKNSFDNHGECKQVVERILICGNRSFVATGLHKKLVDVGFEVDCFSRGKEDRTDAFVTGDVFNLIDNIYLEKEYDIILNFILIKNEGINENIRYIKELIQFCTKRRVKRLIHVSSIMVYNNKEKNIDENTQIEINTNKTGYGLIKIEVDHYLLSLRDLPFKISFIRPGYILADDRLVPFVKKLPLGFALIKGNKKSILPILQRDAIQDAIANIIKFEVHEPVFLFVPNGHKTKYKIAKELFDYRLIILPKSLIMGCAKILVLLRIINISSFVRLDGMFIESHYNSSKTEGLLKIKF